MVSSHQSRSPEAYILRPQQFSPLKISVSDLLFLNVIPAAMRNDHKSTFTWAMKLQLVKVTSINVLHIISHVIFLKKILLIYPCETHRERQRQGQREKQAPCREPNVGLNPGTAGSGPKPKADAQSLSHPGIPTT